MGAGARLRVGRRDVRDGRFWRAPGGAEVGAGAPLPVGLGDWETCALAAKHGHLDVLKWALERGCPAGAGGSLCARAALGGQLEVLRWLREHDYPWDAVSCAKAAEGGHLETLKWLREHDCPWDVSTVERATAAGHDDVLQWALDNGCPS